MFIKKPCDITQRSRHPHMNDIKVINIFCSNFFFSFITNTCSRGESYVINIPYSSLKCKSED